jgi:peptidylprolyl isomerase
LNREKFHSQALYHRNAEERGYEGENRNTVYMTERTPVSSDKGKSRFIPVICVVAAMVLTLVIAGCTSTQATAKTGDTVRVFYSVGFPDGTVFETNENMTPLEFTVGSGQVIPGFNDAVIGLAAGQSKTVTVPAEQAYGPVRPDFINDLDSAEVITNIQELEKAGMIREIRYPGMDPVFEYQRSDGSVGYLKFSNITETTITVDENHPLAGKDLVFTIRLSEIVPKS